MIDDDIIDVSHITEEDRREHMRRINQLATCPCMNCTAECNRWMNVASCDAYQEWREYNMHRRGRKR